MLMLKIYQHVICREMCKIVTLLGRYLYIENVVAWIIIII